jgi:hypothetical protein
MGDWPSPLEGVGVICRFCETPLRHIFVDLGMSPLANAYLESEQLGEMEPFFPLRAYVCEVCFLVQLDEFASPQQIFGNYAYFSSYADSWLQHAKAYTENVIARLGLDGNSQIVEIASNDGYLLKFFKKCGIPVLGVEPARNVADAAINAGIPTVVDFFGTQIATRLAAQGRFADLLIGNNVLAHVPMLNDFVTAMRMLLKPQGVITMEFPYLVNLMQENQFDTIYHEHLSYFSFIAVDSLFARHGLTIFDVDELDTHGGSLRIYARHANHSSTEISPGVQELKIRELRLELNKLTTYSAFAEQAKAAKRALLTFLIEAKQSGKMVAAYGAPAKGNTLLNYCGIGTDFLEYTIDRSPHKQGRFLPGTRIPIYHPDRVMETKPDYLLILPWNLRDEICMQMAHVREWGCRFVVPIPRLEILP